MKCIILTLGFLIGCCIGILLGCIAFFTQRHGCGSTEIETFFQPGREYIYNYFTALTATTLPDVGFLSVLNLTGELRIRSYAGFLEIQLRNLSISLNRKNSHATFQGADETLDENHSDPFPALESLTEPFFVWLENGKIRELRISKAIPLWTHNLQKSIAFSLQIDHSQVDLENMSIRRIKEETINGRCTTEYVSIADTTDSSHGQVVKYSFLEKCSSAPRHIRAFGLDEVHCLDSQVKSDFNVFKTTAVNVYTFGVTDEGLPTVTRLEVGSSVTYSLAGGSQGRGVRKHSFEQMSAALKAVKLKTFEDEIIAQNVFTSRTNDTDSHTGAKTYKIEKRIRTTPAVRCLTLYFSC